MSAEPNQAEQPDAAAPERGRAKRGRRLIGRVTSSSMDKTVVVESVRYKMHPVYEKYVKVRKRYKAHDEKNEYQVGDRVEIREHRPVSKHKSWMVARLLERPEKE